MADDSAKEAKLRLAGLVMRLTVEVQLVSIDAVLER